jgi:hypothetical protein
VRDFAFCRDAGEVMSSVYQTIAPTPKRVVRFSLNLNGDQKNEQWQCVDGRDLRSGVV